MNGLGSPCPHTRVRPLPGGSVPPGQECIDCGARRRAGGPWLVVYRSPRGLTTLKPAPTDPKEDRP